MKKKKLIILFLILVLSVVALVGCSKDNYKLEGSAVVNVALDKEYLGAEVSCPEGVITKIDAKNFKIELKNLKQITIFVTCEGYNVEQITLSSAQLKAGAIDKTVTLTKKPFVTELNVNGPKLEDIVITDEGVFKVEKTKKSILLYSAQKLTKLNISASGFLSYNFPVELNYTNYKSNVQVEMLKENDNKVALIIKNDMFYENQYDRNDLRFTDPFYSDLVFSSANFTSAEMYKTIILDNNKKCIASVSGASSENPRCFDTALFTTPYNFYNLSYFFPARFNSSKTKVELEGFRDTDPSGGWFNQIYIKNKAPVRIEDKGGHGSMFVKADFEIGDELTIYNYKYNPTTGIREKNFYKCLVTKEILLSKKLKFDTDFVKFNLESKDFTINFENIYELGKLIKEDIDFTVTVNNSTKTATAVKGEYVFKNIAYDDNTFDNFQLRIKNSKYKISAQNTSEDFVRIRLEDFLCGTKTISLQSDNQYLVKFKDNNSYIKQLYIRKWGMHIDEVTKEEINGEYYECVASADAEGYLDVTSTDDSLSYNWQQHMYLASVDENGNILKDAQGYTQYEEFSENYKNFNMNFNPLLFNQQGATNVYKTEVEVYRQVDIEISISNISEILPYVTERMPNIYVIDEFNNMEFINVDYNTMTGKMRVNANNQNSYTVTVELYDQNIQIKGTGAFQITKEVIKAKKLSIQVDFNIRTNK